jgi:small subunit ribosomal protein S18
MSDRDDMQDNDGGDGGGGRVRNDDPLGLRRRRAGKKRPPAFTLEIGFIFDHKDPQQLRYFLTDRGKITPRRISGLTAKQQRALTAAIKRARNLGLLPYTVKG